MGDKYDFVPNYTGPWISNGQFQSSVEFGDRKPKDQLDALSRLHDTAYAKWSDRLHRTVADTIYATEARKLAKKFPELAAFIVQYGNFTKNSVDTLRETSGYGLPGLIVGGIRNMYHLNDYLMNGDKVKKEILNYYKTDPHIELQTYGEMNTQSSVYNPAEDFNAQKDTTIGLKSGGGIKFGPKLDPDVPVDEPGNLELFGSTTNRKGPLGGFIDTGGQILDESSAHRPQAMNATYNPPDDVVVNRKPLNDSKYKYQLGFRPFGDKGRDRPVYYYPDRQKFTQIKRQRRKYKILPGLFD
jgi:hypothetical protein